MISAFLSLAAAQIADLSHSTQAPNQTSGTAQLPGIGMNQNPGQTVQQGGTINAFPNTPKAPPPRTQDISVPPAPQTPGAYSASGRDFSSPLTADEAARIALHLQPNLGVQLGTVQSQQGRTRQIGANLLPQLSVNGGYDRISSLANPSPNSVIQAPGGMAPTGASPVYPYSAATQGRQLLFDFNQTRNLVRQSEALERSDLQNFSVAQLSLVLAVTSGFFNYENALRLVRVNELNVDNRQRQLDLARARLSSGVGEPSDLVTAQTSKSQGILALNEARDAAEQARIQLLQQMGIDPLTPIKVAAESAPEPISEDAHVLTQTALKFRPEVKSAVEALAAARYGLSAAKAVDLPSIYAEIGLGAAGSSSPLSASAANFGLGFTFPVFDGGNREGAVRAARGQITIANSNLQTAALQVRTDVAGAYMSLKSAEQRVVIAQNEVVNAQEAVRVAEGRYSSGLGLFLDITTAQSLLLTAQTDQTNAQNTLDQARTQLRRATGQILTDVQTRT